MYTSILLIISVYIGYPHKQQRILSLPIETVCKQVNMEKQGLVLVLYLLARTSAGEQTVNRIDKFWKIFYNFSTSLKSASNLADFDAKREAHSSKNEKSSYKCVLEI